MNFGQMLADIGATASRTHGAPASVATQPTFVPVKASGAPKVPEAPKAPEAVVSAEKTVEARRPAPSTSFFTSPLFLSVVALMIGGVLALVVWQVFSMSSKVSHLSNSVEDASAREKDRDQVLQQVWQRQLSVEQQASGAPRPAPVAEPPTVHREDLSIDSRMKAVASQLRVQQESSRQSRDEQVRTAGETMRIQEQQRIEAQVRAVEAPPPRRRRRAAKKDVPAEEPPKEPAQEQEDVQEDQAEEVEPMVKATVNGVTILREAKKDETAPRRSSRRRKKQQA